MSSPWVLAPMVIIFNRESFVFSNFYELKLMDYFLVLWFDRFISLISIFFLFLFLIVISEDSMSSIFIILSLLTNFFFYVKKFKYAFGFMCFAQCWWRISSRDFSFSGQNSFGSLSPWLSVWSSCKQAGLVLLHSLPFTCWLGCIWFPSAFTWHVAFLDPAVKWFWTLQLPL